MRPILNEEKIKRRSKIGQYVSWAGLAVLAIGMVISLRAKPGDPNSNIWLMVSFGCLIIGFIAANIGGYNMRRFGRSPRPDERLAKALKGFDDRYMLFSWMLPAAYVFAGPSGIYAFSVRDQGGKVSNFGGRWKQPFSLGRLLLAFGQEGLGNPTMESREEAQKMQKYLAAHMPEFDVTVQPMVLFIHPQVELELQNPEVPVVTPKGLKSVLRQRAKQTRLPAADLEAIEKLFTSTPK